MKFATLNLLLIVVIFAPIHADASVFSYILGKIKPTNTTANQSSPNSQNLALLQAPISPNGAQGGASKDSVKIVEGTSLLSSAEFDGDGGASGSTVPAKDQISLYVVRSGDTLPAIAKMFGVTKNTIIWANDLSGENIKVGQTLVILPISGIEHTVKSGDTVSSIAKQHKGDINEILQYNDLTLNSKLAVGDIVIVPDGEVTQGQTSKPTTKPTTTTTKPASSTGFPVYEGYYMRPIIGGVKTQGIHGHNGVDLASAYGSSILASADGTVLISRSSGWNGGYGSYIVLSHDNGTQTLYGHLSGTVVNVGDHVEQGQLIGYMGSTGNSTGTHLHFEIRGAKNPF